MPPEFSGDICLAMRGNPPLFARTLAATYMIVRPRDEHGMVFPIIRKSLLPGLGYVEDARSDVRLGKPRGVLRFRAYPFDDSHAAAAHGFQRGFAGFPLRVVDLRDQYDEDGYGLFAERFGELFHS